MELREDAQWSLVVPTSMGVRITPENRAPVHTSDRFFLQTTSAETNVATVVSYLGEPAKVLTAFVEGSPISALIKADLRKRNLAYEGKEFPQGDAWGYRHQFNIADSGFGLRAPRVWNDRAGEIGRTIRADDFDLDCIFGDEGVGILHLSGLIAAMSPETTQCCLELARVAKKYGTLVSFDLNYRASLWSRDEAAAVLGPLARQADILFGADDELRLALDDAAPTDDALRALGPAQVVLKRGADGAGLVTAEGRFDAPSVATAVVDPVGAGDAFAAGFLSAHLDGLGPVERLGRGNAVAAFALGNHGDWEGLPTRAELPLVGAGDDVVR